jgi:hypothetical protein
MTGTGPRQLDAPARGGHAMTGYGFDRDAEYSAWLRQSRLYHGLARWAAATELHAEHSVTWTTRQFPEHKAILLPRQLLRRSSSSFRNGPPSSVLNA